MKKTIRNFFGHSAVLAVGVFMVLSPVAVMARGGGGGGGHVSVGGARGYLGGARIGVRGGFGGFGGRYYGGAWLGIGVAPYGYGYYPGYAYGPGYAVAPVPQPCGQAVYDSYGNPIQSPACYSGQQPYMQQQYNAAPQQQYGPAQPQQYPAQPQYPQQQQPQQPQYPQQQQYYSQPRQ